MVAALNAQNRNDEAYQLMRFAAANMPGSLPIHINLALAAKRAGNKDEAPRARSTDSRGGRFES